MESVSPINRQRIRIVVDADACPVKNEIAATAREFGATVLMVASFDHRMSLEDDNVTIVQVDRSDQSVDLYIANQLMRGDVLVTQDFGLATIGLAKGAAVLSNRGQRYTDETIGFLLERRHEHARRRRAGHYGKGPKPFTQLDRVNFQQCLTQVLQQLQENVSH